MTGSRPAGRTRPVKTPKIAELLSWPGCIELLQKMTLRSMPQSWLMSTKLALDYERLVH